MDLVREAMIADLVRMIVDGTVVAIVGSGVSRATTSVSPTWRDLIEGGVEECRASGKSEEWCQDVREALANEDMLPLAAGQVHLALQESGQFGAWLEETFGSIQPDDRRIIESLLALDIPLVTTNYDDLIEAVTDLAGVSWRAGSEVVKFARGEKYVLHIHGHWKDPESVVFGTDSYELIKHDANAQRIIQALATTKSLLFVGCGIEGMSDPNIGNLLSWLADVETEANAKHCHYCLVREGEPLPLPAGRLIALPYGGDYPDLPAFLTRLEAFCSTRRLENKLDADVMEYQKEGLPCPDYRLREYYNNRTVLTIDEERKEFLCAAQVASNPMAPVAGWYWIAQDDKAEYRRVLQTMYYRGVCEASVVRHLCCVCEGDSDSISLVWDWIFGNLDEDGVVTAVVKNRASQYDLSDLPWLYELALATSFRIHEAALSAIEDYRSTSAYCLLSIISCRSVTGVEEELRGIRSAIVGSDALEIADRLAEMVSTAIENGHHQEDVRNAALKALAGMPVYSAEHLALLAALVEGDDPALSDLAEASIARFEDRELLLNHVSHIHRADRLAEPLSAALCRFQQNEDLKLFCKAASEKTGHEIALRAIARYRKPRNMEELERLAFFLPDGYSETFRTPEEYLAVAQARLGGAARKPWPIMPHLEESLRAIKAAKAEIEKLKPTIRSLDPRLQAIRRYATRAISAVPSEENRGRLLDIADHPDDDIAADAIAALVSYPCLTNHHCGLLFEKATSDRPSVREAATRAIALIRDRSVLPFLRELADNQNSSLRRSAILALAGIADSDDRERLRKEASSDDPDVLFAVLCALRNCGDETDWPLYYRVACDSQQAEPSRVVALQALSSFQGIPDGCDLQSADELVERLNRIIEEEYRAEVAAGADRADLGSETRLACEVLKLIESISESDVFPIFEAIAKDETEDLALRQTAIDQIVNRNTEAAVDVLFGLLLADNQNTDLLQRVITGLAELSTPSSQRILVTLLSAPSEWGEPLLEDIVAAIDLDDLRDALRNDNRTVRTRAAQELCDREDRATLEGWFAKSAHELPDDVLYILDEFLYAPEWWKRSELRRTRQADLGLA